MELQRASTLATLQLSAVLYGLGLSDEGDQAKKRAGEYWDIRKIKDNLSNEVSMLSLFNCNNSATTNSTKNKVVALGNHNHQDYHYILAVSKYILSCGQARLAKDMLLCVITWAR